MIHTPHTWIELSKSAFFTNVAHYKHLIGPHRILSIVLKSNAYGHGLPEMGKLAQESRHVDWICTATLSEAVALRRAGVAKPILVLSVIDNDPTLLATLDLEMTVYNLELAQLLNEIGRTQKKIIPVHLKIDTGLSRFGFTPEQALAPIQQIKALPYLRLNGIYTHFAQANNKGQEYTYLQLERFDKLCTQLRERGIEIPYHHATNSAGTTLIDLEAHTLNFVRIGAGAYGLWPSAENKALTLERAPEFALTPVLSWKTRVMEVRTFPARTYVGYDRTYQTTEPTTIAILPVGYFDAYDRRLSNKSMALIVNDYYAHVVGRICMNATMVAIPKDKPVRVGDVVTLLGDQDHIRAQDLVDIMGSFNPREIVTRLNPAIKRLVVD